MPTPPASPEPEKPASKKSVSEEKSISETSPPYPNTLRQVREQAMLSRAMLIRLCAQLQTKDDIKYVKVSMTTLHDLEAGTRRPRRSTAATLSAALDELSEKLFPAGFDDPIRNPEGNTSNPENWTRKGRPRNKGPK